MLTENLKRQPDENIRQYTIRLCRNKDEYDLNWQDIADLINKETGDTYTESKYRKFWSAYSEGYEDAIKDNISSNEIIEEIESKTIRFLKEKIKYQDQKREYNNLLRIYTRAEHLIELMQDNAREIAKTKPLIFGNQFNSFSNSNRQGLLLLSDWHIGLDIDLWMNKFNINILNKRLQTLTDKVVRYGHDHQIQTLKIALLGDFASGLINVSNRVMQEEDVITQIQIASEKIAEMSAYFSGKFENVEIYSVTDNHSRLSPNKKDSIDKENFCRLIPWYLQARLQNISNIKIVENEYYGHDFCMIDMFGEKILGVHGHRDSLNNIISNLYLMFKDTSIKYILCGHYHKNYENTEHDITVIVNESLSGVDEYAKDIRKTGRPGQKFIIFDKYEGRLCTYPIKLS